MREALLKAWSRKEWFPFLISALFFLCLLKFSWLKWGDLIIDSGREMYVPFELAKGKLLYRDVSYLYGPFSPYFNAVIFKIFGTRLNSLIASGILTAALTSLFIYKIAGIFLGRLFSVFCVLTFLLVFAFGQYVYLGNYNFILPYSYPAIHAALFSLAALYSFYLSFFKKSRHKLATCVFITLVFLCRIEMAVMLTLSIAVTLVIYALARRSSFKETSNHLLVYSVLPVIFSALIYGLFFIGSFEIIKKSNLFDILSKNMSTSSLFTKNLSGIYDISGNALLMLKTLLYYIILGVSFIIAGFIIDCLLRQGWRLRKMIILPAVSAAFLAATFIFFKNFFTYNMQYICLPLICLLTIVISIWKYIKFKEETESLFIITVSIFSLFLMMRMFFYVWAGHYGFYLLIPGMLIYYVFFFRIIPEGLGAGVVKESFRAGFLWIFILFIISHFNISKLCYQDKTLMVSSERGSLYVFDNERERRCNELIEFLKAGTRKEESLVVFPEGLTINFLSGRNNPLYYYTYLPLDLAKEGVSEGIIADMQDKYVDYVALVQRDTAEYGYAVFGRDYGVQLWQYISENYIIYKQFGPFPFTSRDFGIALFRRKPATR